MNKGFLFERCFVSFVSKLALERCGSHSEFGRLVFTDAESPINTWRNIRNGNRGKLRDITLKEAFQMAEALGTDLETLCWKVQKELEGGWTLAQDICHQEEAKSGRPRKRNKEESQLVPQPAPSESQKNLLA